MHPSRPGVALESTLVAQGLPFPLNWAVSRSCERIVYDQGAIPYTIAVVQGTVKIGLDGEELLRLAESGTFVKVGRRELSWAVALKKDAATTVSATLFLARTHGLNVMATGGLGGVHRDWSRSLDVSNDLAELAAADGALVVCSGFKSLLDVPASLEALEALGVAFVGYRTDEAPGFLARGSGVPLETTVDSPEEAAALVREHRRLKVPGAIVLAQPVPNGAALDRDEVEGALTLALEKAQRQGVRGKPLTPFLLEQTRAMLGERATDANFSLIVNNARLAGAIAVRLQ